MAKQTASNIRVDKKKTSGKAKKHRNKKNLQKTYVGQGR